jgi:hypothetical protein
MIDSEIYWALLKTNKPIHLLTHLLKTIGKGTEGELPRITINDRPLDRSRVPESYPRMMLVPESVEKMLADGPSDRMIDTSPDKK